MWKLIEPVWGEQFLRSLYQWMLGSEFLIALIPLLADIFVFLYPIFLVVVYIYGMKKKKIEHKIAALWIFLATLLTVIINIGVQCFFDKQRPNVVLGFTDEKVETFLHRFLPSSAFPSDHSALSMGFAIACLLVGLRYKKPLFVWGGILFILCSIVMGLARITVAVHWPTDVIGGFALGVLVPLLFFRKPIYRNIETYMIRPLIKLEKRIFKVKK